MIESGRTDGKGWDEILADEGGLQDLPDEDMKARRLELESRLKRPPTNEELCLYVQFPRDVVDFIRFGERFGQTWLLPPDVWFHRGGFADGARISFADETGKTHNIDLISTRKTADGVQTSFLLDYHFQSYTTVKGGKE